MICDLVVGLLQDSNSNFMAKKISCECHLLPYLFAKNLIMLIVSMDSEIDAICSSLEKELTFLTLSSGFCACSGLF